MPWRWRGNGKWQPRRRPFKLVKGTDFGVPAGTMLPICPNEERTFFPAIGHNVLVKRK
jgi:hypothetical protein